MTFEELDKAISHFETFKMNFATDIAGVRSGDEEYQGMEKLFESCESVWPTFIYEIKRNLRLGYTDYSHELQSLLDNNNFIRDNFDANTHHPFWRWLYEKLDVLIEAACLSSGVNFQNLSKSQNIKDDLFLKISHGGLTMAEVYQIEACVFNSPTISQPNDKTGKRLSKSVSKNINKSIITFDQLFVNDQDKCFVENLLRELKVVDRNGICTLTQRKRGALFGIVRALREKQIIPNYPDKHLMTAFTTYTKTYYSRIKDDSNLFDEYYKKAANAIKKRKL